MAPYSPAIGLSLAHESQAPPPPKLSTKLLSSLLSPQIQVLPLAKDGVVPTMKPRKLDYSPHISNTHGTPAPIRKARSSWPGLSTVLLSVLLVMLIGISSSQLQYEQVGREQSMLDVVKDAYFAPGVRINERQMEPKVYLVKEMSSDMDMKMRKRDDTPTSSIAPPVSSPSAVLIASSTSSTISSSVRPAPSPTGAKANFRNPDDVRDPTAVKPSDDMDTQPPPDDTQPPSDMPNKRHWSSRNRAVNLGKRSP